MTQWFYHRFRFRLAEGDSPLWWLDLAVLDLVVRAVLRDHRVALKLWRVHRRCNPGDEAGHQFTFLAYCGEGAANEIDRTIRAHALTQTLLAEGWLREYRLASLEGDTRGRAEASSDPGWPKELRRAWPPYIMGVSEMLLELVRELADGGEAPEPSRGVVELQAFYEGIAERMTQLWRQYGSHAYLHHLNALFGYQPLVVRPRTQAGALMSL